MTTTIIIKKEQRIINKIKKYAEKEIEWLSKTKINVDGLENAMDTIRVNPSNKFEINKFQRMVKFIRKSELRTVRVYDNLEGHLNELEQIVDGDKDLQIKITNIHRELIIFSNSLKKDLSIYTNGLKKFFAKITDKDVNEIKRNLNKVIPIFTKIKTDVLGFIVDLKKLVELDDL